MEDWNGFARLIGFPDEKSMLTSFYVDESLPISEIARKLGKGPATIAHRLERHHIDKRGRGGANNSHQISKTLLRLDQRLVFGTETRTLAIWLDAHDSTVYKYKRSVLQGKER